MAGVQKPHLTNTIWYRRYRCQVSETKRNETKISSLEKCLAIKFSAGWLHLCSTKTELKGTAWLHCGSRSRACRCFEAPKTKCKTSQKNPLQGSAIIRLKGTLERERERAGGESHGFGSVLFFPSKVRGYILVHTCGKCSGSFPAFMIDDVSEHKLYLMPRQNIVSIHMSATQDSLSIHVPRLSLPKARHLQTTASRCRCTHSFPLYS